MFNAWEKTLSSDNFKVLLDFSEEEQFIFCDNKRKKFASAEIYEFF